MNPAERSLDLARLLEGTSISLLSLTTGAETVTLRRHVGAFASASAPAAEFLVVAPCTGIFLRTHPLRSEYLAETGRFVETGAVLGLLKIGSLLVEIRAPEGGRLLAVIADDGALVGFGTPLLRLSRERNDP